MKYVWFGVLLLLGQLVPELLFPEDVTVEPGRYAAMAGTAVLAAVVLFVWERWSRGQRVLRPRRARAYEGEV
ncbi:hypothetical protein [Actinopolyspora mortivallis]|uniref:hypothetical protein n=1 Tax=Actinopolyspora mortivallis TaxID=33906 RepID=UPI0003731341|nr:hypothetical protein [Actinopolyspora mortivallis]